MLIPDLLVRPAQLYEVDEINDIAVASALDMTPGITYAEHAARNRQRIASTGRANVTQLIERSTDSPELQSALVAALGSLAAQEEASVIGYMFARRTGPDEYFDAEHVLIHGAAVDRNYRHMGVGRKLLAGVCKWSQDMTMPVCAQVADTHTSALRTLEGSGFTQIGTYGPSGDNPVTYQIMAWDSKQEH